MRRLGYRLIDLVVDHLASLSDQRVGRRGSAADFGALVDEPLPRRGRGADDSLRFFFERVLPDTTKVNHPRFHAYIPVPGSYFGTLGAFLSAGTNPFVGSWLGGGAMAALEVTVLRWIGEAVGYEPVLDEARGGATPVAGILTSGGSLANLGGLAAARWRHGGAVLSEGTLYFSSQGHGSAEKAARILGFGSDRLRQIAVDDEYRMDLTDLDARVREDRRAGLLPFFVCANAGTTNTGAIDPLSELAAYCREEGLWFHVDAAYGGFAALCAEGRTLLRGMEAADSLTLDPHKWLYCPMGVGCLLTRHRQALERAFSTSGEYLKDIPADEVNFFNRGPELSRPGRALMVWMLLRSAGIEALSRQVEADLELARLAEELLRDGGLFELASPRGLSIVTFRHRARSGEGEEQRAERDRQLMERSLAEGTVMISSTTLGGRNALRLVVQNHRTDERELRRSIAELERLARLIAGQSSPEVGTDGGSQPPLSR